MNFNVAKGNQFLQFLHIDGDSNNKTTGVRSRLVARSQHWTTVSKGTRSLSASDFNSTDNNQPWKMACCGILTQVHPYFQRWGWIQVHPHPGRMLSVLLKTGTLSDPVPFNNVVRDKGIALLPNKLRVVSCLINQNNEL